MKLKKYSKLWRLGMIINGSSERVCTRFVRLQHKFRFNKNKQANYSQFVIFKVFSFIEWQTRKLVRNYGKSNN